MPRLENRATLPAVWTRAHTISSGAFHGRYLDVHLEALDRREVGDTGATAFVALAVEDGRLVARASDPFHGVGVSPTRSGDSVLSLAAPVAVYLAPGHRTPPVSPPARRCGSV